MAEIKALFKLAGPNIDRDSIMVSAQGLRVGRSNDNSLVLNHREISRQHARISWEDDRYFIEDLNSANGTFVNDLHITARERVELHEGDTIRLGPYLMTLMNFIEPEPEILPMPQVPSYNADGDDALAPLANGHLDFPMGIPRDRSNWLQYLPSIYEDDEFLGRYLLVFESIMSPLIWVIDNFDLYLSPEIAPRTWLQWMAGWFDMLLLPELPIERQREIMRQMGWLFLRRGTPAGLQRLLELYFGVSPEIIESEPCHFVVRLPLSQGDQKLSAEVADRLIASQKPAFASYKLEVS